MTKTPITLLFITLILLTAASCGGGGGGGGGGGEPVVVEVPPEDPNELWFSALNATPDWTAETHGKLSTGALAANVPVVFDTSRVRELTIVFQGHNWKLMQSNLADLKAQMGVYDPLNTLPDPLYVPAEVFCDGVEWYKVGVRYKGSSTLYLPDGGKLPLKLKFNEFSDHYPELSNQRFFGFKTLHLKNNFNDESTIHEVLAGNLLRDFGVPVSHANWWRIFVDTGDGSARKYFGLYTMVEDVEDTVLKLQVGSNGGNTYKPEGGAATFAAGTWDTVQFGLQNNEDGADYQDVAALYDAVNDTALFQSDRAAWKAALEDAFDMNRFIRWLAANTVMQNWDTYGVMPKNYYLYNNPTASKLEWIPWDNNEAMTDHPRTPPIDLGNVDADYPLIYYMKRDSGYYSLYREYVAEFANTLYNPAYLNPIVDDAASLVEESVLSESAGYTNTSPIRFAEEVAEIKAQIVRQNAEALNFGQ